MNSTRMAIALSLTTVLWGCSGDDDATDTQASADGTRTDAQTGMDAPDAASPETGPATFFVTSDTSKTGNLGGLLEADARCQALADGAGYSDLRWHAYLSVEHDPENDDQPIHARDRIGEGPWFNVHGELVAAGLDALHARSGDANLFLDENGEKINGQWDGSPMPNEHDVLTGSDAEGRVMPGKTCEDWTSESADISAQIGHSDGLGPGQSSNPPFNSWQSSHANQSCADTAPFGGAGRIYCFADAP